MLLRAHVVAMEAIKHFARTASMSSKARSEADTRYRNSLGSPAGGPVVPEPERAQRLRLEHGIFDALQKGRANSAGFGHLAVTAAWEHVDPVLSESDMFKGLT